MKQMITQGESPLLEVNSLRLDSREKDPALCRLANGWPESADRDVDNDPRPLGTWSRSVANSSDKDGNLTSSLSGLERSQAFCLTRTLQLELHEELSSSEGRATEESADDTSATSM